LRECFTLGESGASCQRTMIRTAALSITRSRHCGFSLGGVITWDMIGSFFSTRDCSTGPSSTVCRRIRATIGIFAVDSRWDFCNSGARLTDWPSRLNL
jgi:hypothetical protein